MFPVTPGPGVQNLGARIWPWEPEGLSRTSEMGCAVLEPQKALRPPPSWTRGPHFGGRGGGAWEVEGPLMGAGEGQNPGPHSLVCHPSGVTMGGKGTSVLLTPHLCIPTGA